MKAQEAREIAEKVITDSIPIHYFKIMEKIERTAARGYFSIEYYDCYYFQIHNILKKMLKKEGFKVSIEYRTSRLRISWK